MVTGIEAAGLGLAIFPLVIEGLKSYSNGARTIKDIWRSQVTLKSLIRELKMEKCKFDNTLAPLLEGVVLDQANPNDPDGKLWRTEVFQNTLKSRLRPDTVEVYIESMEDLHSALESLTNKFELRNKCESGDRGAMRRKWRMIRLVLSKAEYKEQLNQISKINSDLQSLTGQTNASDITFPNTATAQATTSLKNYKRVRDHAMSLHRVLKEKLQPIVPFCQCSTLHNANLRLEIRNAALRQKGFKQNTSIRFHVVISFGGAASTGTPLLRSWRDLEFEPVGSAPQEDEMLSKTSSLSKPHNPTQRTRSTKALPKPSLRSESRPATPRKVAFAVPSTPQIPVAFREPTSQIEHLCLIIQQTESDQSCLGVLADKSGQYRVWPVISSSSPKSTEFISLHNLLDEGKMPAKRDTLVLGVQLASTVLQLHKTGWLAEDWSSRDIFFHQINTKGGIPDFKRPFVRQSPDLGSSLRQTQNIQETTKSALIPHDQSLFSLGIVLIEIWHRCLLEKLRTDKDESGFNTNYMTARRLINEISLDAGAKYGDAVRRCIQGLDHRSGSLDVDDFKSEVHMKVVTPLIKSLEDFCDEDISQIFPERRNVSASI